MGCGSRPPGMSLLPRAVLRPVTGPVGVLSRRARRGFPFDAPGHAVPFAGFGAGVCWEHAPRCCGPCAVRRAGRERRSPASARRRVRSVLPEASARCRAPTPRCCQLSAARKSRPRSGFLRLWRGDMLGAYSPMLSALCGAEVPLDLRQAGAAGMAEPCRPAAAHRLTEKTRTARFTGMVPVGKTRLSARRFRAHKPEAPSLRSRPRGNPTPRAKRSQWGGEVASR